MQHIQKFITMRIRIVLQWSLVHWFAFPRHTLASSTLQQQQDQHSLLNQIQPKIIGGQNANKGTYPFAQVSIGDFGHRCGGSVVAPDMIISAAHCQVYSEQVLVNIYDLSDPRATNVEIFQIQDLFVHEEYNPLNLNHDVMLIKLLLQTESGISTTKTTTTTTTIHPIRLNSNPNLPQHGDRLTVVGWGLTDPTDIGSIAEELQVTNVNYVDTEQCIQVTDDENRSLDGIVTSDMMCAYYPGQDACQGDSGGPLIDEGTASMNDMILMGVTSWGVDPCGGIFPGVYNRISTEYEWLRNIICQESDYPPSYLDCLDVSMSPSESPSLFPTINQQPETPQLPQGGQPPLIQPSMVDITVIVNFREDPKKFGMTIEQIGLLSHEHNQLVLDNSPGTFKKKNQVVIERLQIVEGGIYRVRVVGNDKCCKDERFYYQIWLGPNRQLLVAEGNSDFLPMQQHSFLADTASQNSIMMVDDALYFSTRQLYLFIYFDDYPSRFHWVIIKGSYEFGDDSIAYLKQDFMTELEVFAFGPPTVYDDLNFAHSTHVETIPLPRFEDYNDQQYTIIVMNDGVDESVMSTGGTIDYAIYDGADTTNDNNKNEPLVVGSLSSKIGERKYNTFTIRNNEIKSFIPSVVPSKAPSILFIDPADNMPTIPTSQNNDDTVQRDGSSSSSSFAAVTTVCYLQVALLGFSIIL